MSAYLCPRCHLWFESASALLDHTRRVHDLCDCENCVDGMDS